MRLSKYINAEEAFSWFVGGGRVLVCTLFISLSIGGLLTFLWLPADQLNQTSLTENCLVYLACRRIEETFTMDKSNLRGECIQ